MKKENLDMCCPVCGGKLSRLWPGMNQARFVLFLCPACEVQWRLENVSGASPAPVCPVCQRRGRQMVRMSPKDTGPDGATSTWVCWEDGTLLHNIGGVPVVESFSRAMEETAEPKRACA